MTDKPLSIKGLPLTELSITAIATFVDVYEDENGNEKPVFEMEPINQADWDKFNAPKEDACRCALCGHRLKIACAVTHQPTGNGYWIGRDCTSSITSLQKFGPLIKDATVALAQRLACDKREADFVAKNPDVLGILTWSRRPAAPRICRDMIEKLRRYGSLSEKQVALMEKIRQQDIERRAKATGKAEAGRKLITGTVLKVTIEESEFGSKWHTPTYAKVLLDLGNGVRLLGKLPEYSTVTEQIKSRAPAYLNIGNQCNTHEIVKKGDTIELKATVTQSPKDDLFGFWKRPANFKILAMAPEPVAPVVDLEAEKHRFLDMVLIDNTGFSQALGVLQSSNPSLQPVLCQEFGRRNGLTDEQIARFTNHILNKTLA